MENVKKFYDALANDKAMQERAKALAEKYKDGKPDDAAANADIAAFAKAEGYDFSIAELEEYAKQAKPLDDDQLDDVAGGKAGCGCVSWGGGGGKDETGTFMCGCAGMAEQKVTEASERVI